MSERIEEVIVGSYIGWVIGKAIILAVLLVLMYQTVHGQNWGSYNGNPVARVSFLAPIDCGAATPGTNVLRDSSLVGWWPMTCATGSTARDMSGNGNDGTWTGTKAGTNGYWSTGKNGPWSGHFNGTDNYVKITSTILFSSNPFTISAWANTAGNSSGYQEIWNSGYNGGNVDVELNLLNNKPTAYIRNTSGTECNAGSSSTITLNKWHLLTMTKSSNVLLYVDGAQVASCSIVSGSYDTAGVLPVIGNGNGAINNHWFNGGISDVRIYTRALSQAEIQAIYTRENAMLEQLDRQREAEELAQLSTNIEYGNLLNDWRKDFWTPTMAMTRLIAAN